VHTLIASRFLDEYLVLRPGYVEGLVSHAWPTNSYMMPYEPEPRFHRGSRQPPMPPGVWTWPEGRSLGRCWCATSHRTRSAVRPTN